MYSSYLHVKALLSHANTTQPVHVLYFISAKGGVEYIKIVPHES